MKIRKMVTTITGVLAGIYYLIMIAGNTSKLEGVLAMFTSITALLWGVLLSMLFIWLLNYNTKKDVQDDVTGINDRMDKFNDTIALAGRQSREAIDGVTNELAKIQQRLNDANITSK
ncbi:MAG: hypothetical protein KJ620_09875 [Candidatus Edwardsbacteria bacterium]|nr:hypothetical protein [Candidatus Edwardsbacteria bacterium]MBU2463019.1 hypothetical protein [Candidatus Edwardsbacteria bacterium]MBU2592939.1 hypothetical protein [Candidatus Edwardsbacteria bacterium]